MWALTLVLAEPWDGQNVPGNFQGDRTTQLSAIPTSGQVDPTPWSDTYWPSFEGGIANRWAGSQEGFNYHLYTKAELQANAVDITTLSPAEKFDILNGRYDYPLVHSEWQRVSPDDPQWEGLCHGWAPAAYLYQQPGVAQLSNSDGIQVTFGSSDVKALLIYFLGQVAQGTQTDFIGQRCNTDIKKNPGVANSSECRDLNAGAFFVVIGNQIGLKKQAFVADVDRSIEVWNQPISGYRANVGATRACSTGAAAACVRESQVSLTMQYTKETSPAARAHEANTQEFDYQFTLELDGSGNVVGGAWNTWIRPDFAWTEKTADFDDYFAKLADVYSASLNGTRLARVRAAPHMPFRGAKRLPAGAGTFGVSAYRDLAETHAWCIPAGPRGVAVRFQAVDTRRFRDIITVYEADAQCRRGAPAAVLHGPKGTHRNLDVEVTGAGAIVTFTVNPAAGRRVTGPLGAGFHARYEPL